MMFAAYKLHNKYNIFIINNINEAGQSCGTHVQEFTTHLVNCCDSCDGVRIKNSLTIPYLDVLSLDLFVQLLNFL